MASCKDLGPCPRCSGVGTKRDAHGRCKYDDMRATGGGSTVGGQESKEAAVDKRYQVFISSTRADLELERRTIADDLLRRRYIPIGTEQFGAAAEQAWTLIQRFIDE